MKIFKILVLFGAFSLAIQVNAQLELWIYNPNDFSPRRFSVAVVKSENRFPEDFHTIYNDFFYIPSNGSLYFADSISKIFLKYFLNDSGEVLKKQEVIDSTDASATKTPKIRKVKDGNTILVDTDNPVSRARGHIFIANREIKHITQLEKDPSQKSLLESPFVSERIKKYISDPKGQIEWLLKLIDDYKKTVDKHLLLGSSACIAAGGEDSASPCSEEFSLEAFVLREAEDFDLSSGEPVDFTEKRFEVVKESIIQSISQANLASLYVDKPSEDVVTSRERWRELLDSDLAQNIKNKTIDRSKGSPKTIIDTPMPVYELHYKSLAYFIEPIGNSFFISASNLIEAILPLESYEDLLSRSEAKSVSGYLQEKCKLYFEDQQFYKGIFNKFPINPGLIVVCATPNFKDKNLYGFVHKLKAGKVVKINGINFFYLPLEETIFDTFESQFLLKHHPSSEAINSEIKRLLSLALFEEFDVCKQTDAFSSESENKQAYLQRRLQQEDVEAVLQKLQQNAALIDKISNQLCSRKSNLDKAVADALLSGQNICFSCNSGVNRSSSMFLYYAKKLCPEVSWHSLNSWAGVCRAQIHSIRNAFYPDIPDHPEGFSRQGLLRYVIADNFKERGLLPSDFSYSIDYSVPKGFSSSDSLRYAALSSPDAALSFACESSCLAGAEGRSECADASLRRGAISGPSAQEMVDPSTVDLLWTFRLRILKNNIIKCWLGKNLTSSECPGEIKPFSSLLHCLWLGNNQITLDLLKNNRIVSGLDRSGRVPKLIINFDSNDEMYGNFAKYESHNIAGVEYMYFPIDESSSDSVERLIRNKKLLYGLILDHLSQKESCILIHCADGNRQSSAFLQLFLFDILNKVKGSIEQSVDLNQIQFFLRSQRSSIMTLEDLKKPISSHVACSGAGSQNVYQQLAARFFDADLI